MLFSAKLYISLLDIIYFDMKTNSSSSTLEMGFFMGTHTM